jgi:hypothetical protein
LTGSPGFGSPGRARIVGSAERRATVFRRAIRSSFHPAVQENRFLTLALGTL